MPFPLLSLSFSLGAGLACTSPDAGPATVLLGPQALDAGVYLEIGGQDRSSALPQWVYPDQEAWVGLPDGQELLLEAGPQTLMQVWLDDRELLVEHAQLGLDIDPDAVLVTGSRAQDLAGALGLQGQADDDGLWLRSPGLWESLSGDFDLPEVQAIWPVELSQVQGLLLQTASVSSPSRAAPGGVAVGANGLSGQTLAGGSSPSSSELCTALCAPTGERAGETAGNTGALIFGGAELGLDMRLVGFYVGADHTLYTLASDGSLATVLTGRSGRGWWTQDQDGQVLLYLDGHGPTHTLTLGADDSLQGRSERLVRLEDLTEYNP